MIEFRRPAAPPRSDGDRRQIDPNRLVLHIQPDEGIELQVKAKRPGPTVRIETVKLDFSYKDFGDTTAATGYERLLYDCMVGDSTLFHRTDMVEAAWQIATPILDAWRALPAPATSPTTRRAPGGRRPRTSSSNGRGGAGTTPSDRVPMSPMVTGVPVEAGR